MFADWFTDNNEFMKAFIFGSSGDVVSRDITLYAQWLDDNPDEDAADLALALVTIGYQEGDGSDYVTRDLTLPGKVNDVDISWQSSNQAAISTSGKVTRPSGQDSQVILTANAGGLSRLFTLRVIHARTRDINDVIDSEPLNHEIIEIMNQDNDAFDILYDDNDDSQIRHIDGQFSELKVENADDALDAVQGLSGSLGIDDPYSELRLTKTNRDEYGSQYSFKQVHEIDGSYSDSNSESDSESGKLEVYGRTVMVSANASGDTDFLSSTFIASEKLDSANGLYTRNTQAQAESAALAYYEDPSNLEAVTSATKKIIYSLGNDYESAPVIAFIVRVTGTISSEDVDIPIDENVIVNGLNLEVIETSSNLRSYIVYNSARDELGERKRFPVNYSILSLNKTLRDKGSPEVVVYNDNSKEPVRIKKTSSWTDAHQISAYTNMRQVIQWWRDTFNRNSIDGEGMAITLRTHRMGLVDNACFSQSNYSISVGNIGNTSQYDLSRAMGLDTLTHETGHAVLFFMTGGISYNNATGAIDDGYADIFGCLRDRDWKHGWRADSDNDPETGITYFKDKTQCLRDAREDISVESLSKGANSSFGLSAIKNMKELYEHYATVPGFQSGSNYNDGNGCHTYCRLVTHAAYLMHEAGVSDIGGYKSQALNWEELGWVWYKSLSMGLDNTSNFHTVRRNVLRAAQQMKLSSYKILTIKKAFDKIEVTNPSGTLTGTVEDWEDGSTISGGATVTLTGSMGLVEKSAKTNSDGSFTIDNIEAGNYSLSISASYGSQYSIYRRRVYIPANKTVRVNAELVKTGTGTLDVYLSDENSKALSGAAVTALREQNNTVYSPTSTQAGSGKYTFSNIPSGNYTIRVSKTGYDNHVFSSIIVPPGTGTTKNIFMTIYPEVKKYYVLIDDLPVNLEAYMIVEFPSQTKQADSELDANKIINAPNGREAVRIIKMNLLGYKYLWTLFTRFKSTRYLYYVKWNDTGTETDKAIDWAGSNVRASIYYSGKLLGTYTPAKDKSGQYWAIFEIDKNGNRKAINEFSDTIPVMK